MRFLDYIRFGLKNIWRQKARTILTIIAIMIGALSVVLMLTIIFGAKDAAISQIENSGVLTQVTVSGNTSISGDDVFRGDSGGGGTDSIKLTDDLLKKVAAIPHVKSAYAQLGAYSLSNAVVTDASGKKVELNHQQFVGYLPGPNTDKKVEVGRNLIPSDVYHILIGKETLEAMGLKDRPQDAIGQVLSFGVQGYVGDDTNVPLPPDPGSGPGNKDEQDAYWKGLQEHIGIHKLTVVGVMATGLYDQQNFVPLALAKKMITQNQWQMDEMKQDCSNPKTPCMSQKPTYTLTQNTYFDQQGYSSFALLVDELGNVDTVAGVVKGMALGAATAKSVIDQILQIFKLVSIVFGTIGGISLFVAAIGVINTMIMATLERTREIGVMRACGATRATVRRLFTFEAALLGFWGGLIGCGVAYAAIAIVARFFGSELVRQGVPESVLSIPLWLSLATVAGTTIVGMLAGYWPAVRAAKLNPVEALRYE